MRVKVNTPEVYVEQMVDLVAAVFPLPKEIVSRIFKGRRTVFVKYMPTRGRRGKFNTQIEPGTKMVIYESKGTKSLMGEALIKKVLFMMPNEAYRTYGNNLCLDYDEIVEYSNKYPNRAEKPLLVLELESPHRYASPIKSPYPISMAGRYLSKMEYDKIFK